MIEEEAKTKWCPMVRTPAKLNDPMPGINRFGTCIGNRCMMWRWVGIAQGAEPNEHGYCGMAGHPMPMYQVGSRL